MKGYITHIEQATVKNSLCRQVLFTAKNSQLVLMSLKPGEEIVKTCLTWISSL
jgi:hypothetical protein